MEDQEAGYVTVRRNPDNSVFDWCQTPTGRLFHVRQSEDQPNHAAMSINFYDRWHYIPNNDLEPKSTFLLLTQLFRLQAGAAKSIGPTLTIPVR